MAYTPKTWACGETITAEKLNNIEEGIQEALECCEGGGGSFYEVMYDYDSETGSGQITIMHNDETIDANDPENFAEVYRILTEERWIPTSPDRTLWGIAYIVEDRIGFYDQGGNETIIEPSNVEP